MLPLSAFAYGNGPYPQPGGGSTPAGVVTNGQDVVSLGAANDKTNTFGGELVNLGKRVQSGIGNTASGIDSFVGGGVFNTASGADSFVAGGAYNIASGSDSFVSGNGNTASGLFGFAAGQNALATNDNSFVWSRGVGGAAQGSDSNGTFTVNASATRLFGGPIYGNGSGLTGIPGAQVSGAVAMATAATNDSAGNNISTFYLPLNGNGSSLTNLQIVTTYKAPGAVTVGASPFLFTNTTATDMRCFISGGGSSVAVGLNATTVAASFYALDYSLIIGPTEYITLTYSVGTPTLYTNKFGR
jgi:hypothetical protein